MSRRTRGNSRSKQKRKNKLIIIYYLYQDLRLLHAQELRKQIILSDDQKKQEERDKLEEGKKIKDNLNKYKACLENIKMQKLNNLKKLGISEKYKTELEKKKIII